MIRRSSEEMGRLAAQPRATPAMAELRRRMAARKPAEAS